ncbi:MAG TPA: hypothetical protein VFN54_08875 [Acidimicrobiales bacterium]|nr:hypothetical protein [Acidimicrobiales bacterium]
MPRPRALSTSEVIATYNPAIGRHHLVSPAEWALIGALVREIAAPFEYLKGEQIRPYLRAATKLTAFVVRLEGELSVEAVLAPATIRGFLRQLPVGAPDEEPYLWRLARAHGTMAPDAPVRHQIGRRSLKAPYSAEELEALLMAARTQSTELRRANVLAIVVLGAGCGLVRESVRDVCASDRHEHEDGVYVRAAGRCARVLSNFEEGLDELVRLRPSGRLLGPAQVKFSTVKAHQWLDGRRGIPRLSVDRLRASYVVTMLSSGFTLREVMQWSGLTTFEAMSHYVMMLPSPSTCPREDVR